MTKTYLSDETVKAMWEEAWRTPSATMGRTFATRVTDALWAEWAQGEAERIRAAQEKAARMAWDAGWRSGSLVSGEAERARDRYLATHYAPVPRECKLSDGSVVTYEKDDASGRWHRREPEGCWARFTDWRFALYVKTDTGADFDALKQFAATVQGAR